MTCRLFGAKPFPWINGDLLLIGPFRTNFVEKGIEVWNFSFTKIHLKMSSAAWRPFCPGKDESIRYRHSQGIDYITTTRHSSIKLCAYLMGCHGIWIPTVNIRQPNKCLIWIPEILTMTKQSYWIKSNIFHVYLNTHTHTSQCLLQVVEINPQCTHGPDYLSSQYHGHWWHGHYGHFLSAIRLNWVDCQYSMK